MKTSFRLFALAAVLSLVAAPALRAERLGTNPHPPTVDASGASSLYLLEYTLLIGLGV